MFARLTQRARPTPPDDIAARRLRALAPPVTRQPDTHPPGAVGPDRPANGPTPAASADHIGAPAIPPPPYAAEVDAPATAIPAPGAVTAPVAPPSGPATRERPAPDDPPGHGTDRPEHAPRSGGDRDEHHGHSGVGARGDHRDPGPHDTPRPAPTADDDLPPGYVSVDDTPPHPLRALAEHYLRSPGTPRVGGPGLTVAAVVCGAAILVTGFVVLAARPDPGTEPLPPGGDLASPAAAADGPAADPEAPPPAGSSPTADLVVHVGGEVEDPGLVTLPAGSRVADAIDAAGGVHADADPDVTDALNLARHLVDGEQVLVGADPPAAAGGGTDGAGNGTPIDLNTATAEELQELPGIGPVLSENIVEYRTANGGFESVDQLIDVSGIGDKRLDDLRDRVVVAGSP